MNKKGFTLIELLAVIVILAIILLIAMPIVLNVINEAREGAFDSTAQGLVKAAETEFYRTSLSETPSATTYLATNGFDGLEFSGQAPEYGAIHVGTDGKVQIWLSDGTFCSTKGPDVTTVTTTEADEVACEPATFPE